MRGKYKCIEVEACSFKNLKLVDDEQNLPYSTRFQISMYNPVGMQTVHGPSNIKCKTDCNMKIENLGANADQVFSK